MEQIDVENFKKLKTLLVVSTIVYAILVLVFVVLRYAFKNRFKSGRFHKLSGFNIAIIASIIVFIIVALIMTAHGLYKLSYVSDRVANDGMKKAKEVKEPEFYYGYYELRDEFFRIRQLSQNSHEQATELAKMLRDGTHHKLESINHGKQTKQTHFELDSSETQVFYQAERKDSFIERHWPKVLNYLNEFISSQDVLHASDKELCDKAIERIDYVKVRYFKCAKKFTSKFYQGAILIAAVVFIVIIIAFFVFRSFLKNRATQEDVDNFVVPKRMMILSFFTLLGFVFFIAISILTVSLSNSIVAVKEILNGHFMSDTSKMIVPAAASVNMSSEFIEDFRKILELKQSVLNCSELADKIRLIDAYQKIESLKETKDEIIKRVDANIDRSSFSKLYMVQLDLMQDVVRDLNGSLYYMLMWAFYICFVYQVVTSFLYF